ncbi:MAG: DUF99 family protein [Methanobacteriaceae archaeon]|nr:DUF99 family protein [Methanobacteriaceae archaeon]
MNNKRFRRIKKEIRILGIDDAPFTPRTSGEVMLIGTVFRGGTWLDGVLRTEISIDGSDSTDKIVKMICSSRNKDQLGVIMLDGITFGGFNIVNIKQIFEKTEVPVIVVMRKFPNFERIKKALKRFENWKKRWQRILEAGKVYKFDNDETIYFQICGIGLEDAKEILKISTTRSAIPEPIRAAHIIAAGVETGESKGNA